MAKRKLNLIDVRRYEALDPCKTCGMCGGGRCDEARTGEMRSYAGIRFTSDGFDCALPVTIDSHSMCSFACLYCFSEQLQGHIDAKKKGLGQMSLGTIESIFSGGGGQKAEMVRKALKYDHRNEGGFPCPVQLGGINDPGDNIERQQGWFLRFVELCIKYNQPVRISTKGTTFREPDYLKAFAKAPHLFWVTFSIITPDDELIERIDIGAPNATERLKTMEALSKVGVSTALRFRPMFPGVSDRTPRYPQAYKTLIQRAAKAGARAISYECGFYPSRGGAEVDRKWQELSRQAGVPFKQLFKKIGSKEACMRPSFTWTENIMHAVREEAHKCGMTVGVSDPIWKQLTDTGCCCGILPDDPVFGNWERENATHQLMMAKDHGEVIWPEDIIPPWADLVLASEMAALGVGPLSVWDKRHKTWAQKLREVWNDPRSQRGPLVYFQGALQPVDRKPNGDIGYKYVGLKRSNPEQVPFWDLRPGKAKEKPKKLKAHCRWSEECDGDRCKRCIVEDK